MKPVWIARIVTVCCWALGSAYSRSMFISSQSDAPSKEIMEAFWLMYWLPATAVILLPALLMYPSLLQKCRWWKIAISSLLPAAFLALGCARKWGDWDELFLFILMSSPCLLMIAWLAWCSRRFGSTATARRPVSAPN